MDSLAFLPKGIGWSRYLSLHSQDTPGLYAGRISRGRRRYKRSNEIMHGDFRERWVWCRPMEVEPLSHSEKPDLGLQVQEVAAGSGDLAAQWIKPCCSLCCVLFAPSHMCKPASCKRMWSNPCC